MRYSLVRWMQIGPAWVIRNKIMRQEFRQYHRSTIAELRPYEPGENLQEVSISVEDRRAGSPKKGDMIARSPETHGDKWLVAARYFARNFEPI